MAQNKEVVVTTETNRPNGHQVHYTICLPNSPRTETKSFVREHQTRCEVLPVSWNLQIIFPKTVCENTVCSFKLKRTDNLNYPVKALIRVALTNTSRPVGRPFFQKIFEKEDMKSGDEFSNPIASVNASGQGLIADVSVFIMYCHSETASNPATDAVFDRYGIKKAAVVLILALFCWKVLFVKNSKHCS